MLRVAALALVLALVPVACGGGNSGDLEAFCALIKGGAGDLSQGLQEPARFDELLAVAPDEVRPAVERLRNLASNINDIDPKALDQLFAAAFDTKAQSARQDFDAYVSTECGVDNATSGGAAQLDTEALAGELATYIADTYGDDSWVDKVHYDIVLASGQPWAVTVTFDGTAAAGEAAQACERVSTWLYDVELQTGSIEVVGGQEEIARAGPQGSCAGR